MLVVRVNLQAGGFADTGVVPLVVGLEDMPGGACA